MRMSSVEQHIGHHDLEWIEQEQNKERLLQGHLMPLALGGMVIEMLNDIDLSIIPGMLLIVFVKLAYKREMLPILGQTEFLMCILNS
jgi:hypothetical protein